MTPLEEAKKAVDDFLVALQKALGVVHPFTAMARNQRSELLAMAIGSLKASQGRESWIDCWKYAVKRWRHNGWAFPSPVQVVAFLNDGTHVRATLPPLKVLRERGVKVQVLTTKESLLEAIRQEGFTAHLCMGIDNALANWAKARAHPAMNTPERQRFFDFLERSESKYRFLQRYFNDYIGRTQPKYALIGNDLTLEGSLFRECCAQQSVRTGSVQHGSMDSSNPRNSEVEVDDLFVYGKKTFEELKKIGLPAKTIQITGKPGLKLSIEKGSLAGEVKKRILVGISGKGVLCSEAHHIEIVKGLLQAARHLEEVKWTFKLHPKDSSDYYSPLPPNAELLTNADLQRRGTTVDSLIEASSLVVSGGSTFSLDAILKGKPVVTFDLRGEFASVPFVVDGLTHYVQDIEALKAFVEQYFKEGSLPAMPTAQIEHYYYKIFEPEYSPEGEIAHYIQALCVR